MLKFLKIEIQVFVYAFFFNIGWTEVQKKNLSKKHQQVSLINKNWNKFLVYLSGSSYLSYRDHIKVLKLTDNAPTTVNFLDCLCELVTFRFMYFASPIDYSCSLPVLHSRDTTELHLSHIPCFSPSVWES